MSSLLNHLFRPDLTPQETYNIANTLPTDYLNFAIDTHYYHRLFGVLTGAEQGGDFGDFLVNQCLREAIWDTLYNVTESTEQAVGFNLSPRYHQETIDFPWSDRTSVHWPGIEAVNVAPLWESIPDLTNVTIDPYIQRNATVGTDGDVIYVEMDGDLVENPHSVWIRHISHMGAYATLPSGQYNYPQKVGGNWRVAIDTKITPLTVIETVHIQHRKYVFVDITPPALEDCEGEVYPVFPDTNQKIPQAKPSQNLLNGDVRYWFYVYTLVHPEFFDGTIDLISSPPEFYKLLPEIEFKCFTEVETKARLVRSSLGTTKNCLCNCCSSAAAMYEVSAITLNSESGVLNFRIDGKFEDDGVTVTPINNVACSDLFGCGCPNLSYKLTFYYKTNPKYLSENLKKSVSPLLQAIRYRTAADLPVVDCGCVDKEKRTDTGFISEQQKSFGIRSFNPITNETVLSFQYGDLRGQKVYADILRKTPKFKFTFI